MPAARTCEQVRSGMELVFWKATGALYPGQAEKVRSFCTMSGPLGME